MKKPPIKILVISCLAAAVFTVTVLSVVSAYAKSVVRSRDSTPDYVRYQSAGYDFDTVTSKTSILFCIIDKTDIARCHLFTLDEDKHTLDILDMPPSTLICCDGFEGMINDAYSTDIFPQLISRFLMLDISYYAYISSEDFTAACKLLSLPEREDIVLASGAYLTGDEKLLKQYYSLLSSLIKKLDEIGSVEATAKLMGILINGVETNMTVSDMIDFASETNSVSLKETKLHLLPGKANGTGKERAYYPDAERTAELLNSYFRVKGSNVPPSKLGISDIKQTLVQFEKLPQKITDY